MRTEAEIRAAIRQMGDCMVQAHYARDEESSRAADDILRALRWVICEQSDFGELLEQLEAVDRARRQ